MFTSFLRFVGIIAFMGAFTSSAFAASCGSTKYKGYDNNCYDCPSGTYQDVATSGYGNDMYTYPRTCGNDVFECPYNAFKVQYNGSTYGCMTCPGANNRGTTGAPSGVGAVRNANDYTWSTSVRCQGTVKNDGAYDNGCTYTRTFKASESAFPAGDIPNGSDVSNQGFYGTGMAYEVVKKQYTYAPAGKGASNNGTANATCVACSSGTYSTESMVTCKSVPSHSTSNSDRTYFVCDAGYYDYNVRQVCLHCPVDLSTWEEGTNNGSSTKLSDCYHATTGSDGSGQYTNSACYLDAGYYSNVGVDYEYDFHISCSSQSALNDAISAMLDWCDYKYSSDSYGKASCRSNFEPMTVFNCSMNPEESYGVFCYLGYEGLTYNGGATSTADIQTFVQNVNATACAVTSEYFWNP